MTDEQSTESELTRMLRERGGTHGSLLDQAAMAQTLQRAMRMSPQWLAKGVVTRYCLEMIQMKISRIIEGEETFEDHWDDLIGYATKGKEYAGQGEPAQDYSGGKQASMTQQTTTEQPEAAKSVSGGVPVLKFTGDKTK